MGSTEPRPAMGIVSTGAASGSTSPIEPLSPTPLMMNAPAVCTDSALRVERPVLSTE